MSEYTTRSVYGAYLQTCKQLGLPFQLVTSTTLNEKFNIQSGVQPDAGIYPNVRYFAIGNGGHIATIGADSHVLLSSKLFKATNAALYNHLPFVLRALGNDLSPTERSKYALRRLEVIDGVTYAAYYLKRIDMTGVTASMALTTVQDGISVTTPFVPDSSCLNPTPPATPSSGFIITDGTYVSAKAPLQIILDEIDTTEFLNVIDLKFQDRDYAMLSELALCSGVDLVVPVTDPGNASFNMNEAIGVQVCDMVNVAAPLQFNSEGVKFGLDIGATEPLFKV